MNTAARIESLTKSQKSEILVSESCFSRLPGPYQERFDYLGKLDLKGKAQSVAIYGIKK